MYRTVLTVVVCGLILSAGRNASAQSQWEDRGYINANFAVQSSTSDQAGGKTYTIYEETGAVAATSSFSGPQLFDVGAGVRVWKNVSVGVAYHQGTSTADTALKGTAPHPVFFNQPRTYTATVAGLERKESGTHLQFGWTIPLGKNMDVQMFGGPTFFRLQQDSVTDIKIVEKGSPFTEVIVTPTVSTTKKSVVGYNVGADFGYMFWSNDSVRVGAGAFVRYAAAKADVPVFATANSTDVGGIQFGFGGRLRF